MARGNFIGSTILAPRAPRLVPCNFQPSTLNLALAASEGLGRSGSRVDFNFCREFFDARFVAGTGGEIRAAVAGCDRGIKKTAADICGTGRLLRNARR